VAQQVPSCEREVVPKKKRPRSVVSTRTQPVRPVRAHDALCSDVAPFGGVPANPLLALEAAPAAPKQPALPPCEMTDPLTFVTVPFASLSEQVPQALGVTYTFDVPVGGLLQGGSVRFEGRRIGASSTTDGARFVIIQDFPSLPAGGLGRVTLTARAVDIEPGEWSVNARATLATLTGSGASTLTAASGTGRTGFAPVVRSRAPGVVLGAWPGLVLAGVIAGLIVQVFLARHAHLPVGKTTSLLAVSSVVGLAGAKAYFLALYRSRQAQGMWQTGLAIQGFVLAAVATAAAGAALLAIPVRPFLDVTAVSLLVGMTIGRWGCFYGGCCVGRPTASRWGRWSSDRTLGVRRVPTQLLESGLAGSLAALAGTAVVLGRTNTRGLVFVGAVAGYTLGRQLLFPLRDLPRGTRTGRSWVLAASAVIFVADLLTALFVSVR
jgi:phosphatidylglycerol:prolipoprotein diacylglycerol transferase